MEAIIPSLFLLLSCAGSAMLGAWIYSRGRTGASPLPQFRFDTAKKEKVEPAKAWMPPEVKP